MFQVQYINHTANDEYFYPTNYATADEARATAYGYARNAHARCSRADCSIRMLEDGYQIEHDGRAMITYIVTGERAPCGGPLPWCESGEPGCRGHYPG